MRLTAMGLAACLALPAHAAEPPANFVVHDVPKLLPEVSFADGDGASRTLTEFRGRTVLLNLWATWCGPCRHEMPTLDRLQGKLGGTEFEVVALSIDRAGVAPVRKFYAEVGVEKLAIFIDPSGKASRDLAALGLPTTLLIDPKGREVGRLVGPAEWDAPAMVLFLTRLIADHKEED